MEDAIQKLDYQPTNLSECELENPFRVISDFFDNNALHDIREKTWQLYKGWVTGSSDYAEGQDNVDMLFFYTQLIDFLNASYLYAEQEKDNT